MAHGGRVDLVAYRQYMRGRFARETVRSRMTVAYAWLALHPEPDRLSYRDVETWLRSLTVSAATVRNRLVGLRALYRWLLREGLVTVDPTILVDRDPLPMRLPRPAPDRVVARMLTRADVEVRALLALMACAGMRCVECSRLDWRDVDLDAAFVIANGKGQRERTIGLSPDVVRTLRALRLASTSRGAVFVGPSGRRLAPHRVSQLVNTFMHEAGEPFTAHQLRHRAATEMYRLTEGDLLAVRDFLGHASVATTQIYTKVANEQAQSAAREMMFPAA